MLSRAIPRDPDSEPILGPVEPVVSDPAQLKSSGMGDVDHTTRSDNTVVVCSGNSIIVSVFC